MTKIDDFNRRMDEALDDAPSLLIELKAHRARIDIEIGRIETFVKAMSDVRAKEAKPRGRPKGNKTKRAYTRTPSAIVRERERQVAVAILSYPHEEFTVPDIRAQMDSDDITSQQVTQAFRHMREAQFIGKMGNKGAQMWRILDATAAEKYTMVAEA